MVGALKLEFLIGMLVFILGVLVGVFLLQSGIDVEIPFLSENLSSEISPGDFVQERDIQVYEDKLVINVPGISLSRYASTGSMRPVIDDKANGVRIIPESGEHVSVGDIVSFRKGSDLIAHRVVEKGEDREGVYFITKGDNSDFTDGKIRFEDIEYVTIAIIY
jgi:hypothetical protein